MVLKREEVAGPSYAIAPEHKRAYMAEVFSKGGKVDVNYFDTLEEARLWLKDHGDGVVRERKMVDWSLPINRKVPLPTWVRVG